MEEKQIEEKILGKKQNGMGMLLLLILTYVVAIVLIVASANGVENGETFSAILFTIGMIWFCLGWVLAFGLKVLRPQEALVLTLFGKYVGTIKKEGFYFVNPFCVAVNPAAKTKLNQSGDVGSDKDLSSIVIGNDAATVNTVNKKISLKIMTLNNNRQKVNDCLGNPVEIGIAVMWRVVDTAKAVFNVDNYKE